MPDKIRVYTIMTTRSRIKVIVCFGGDAREEEKENSPAIKCEEKAKKNHGQRGDSKKKVSS